MKLKLYKHIRGKGSLLLDRIECSDFHKGFSEIVKKHLNRHKICYYVIVNEDKETNKQEQFQSPLTLAREFRRLHFYNIQDSIRLSRRESQKQKMEDYKKRCDEYLKYFRKLKVKRG